MKPTFKGWFEGFDDKPEPKWQSLGQGETTIVSLYNADGLDVDVNVPGIVNVEENPGSMKVVKTGEPCPAVFSSPSFVITLPDGTTQSLIPPGYKCGVKYQQVPVKTVPVKGERVFRLTGIIPGKIFMRVKENGKVLETLEVDVFERLRITTTFNYVHDNAHHHTTRSKDDLDQIISSASLFLEKWANIEIVKHNVRDLFFDRNLGPVVLDQNVWDIIASKRDRLATFNVFFVWEYEQDNTPNIDNAEGAAGNRVCMIEDNLSYLPFFVLIHELCHLMGLPHHKVADNYMDEYTAGGYFTKNQVIAMRGILRHIFKLIK